jgi:hypothetical protein
MSAEDLLGLKASIDLWSDRTAIAALVRRDELRSAGPTEVLPGTVTFVAELPDLLAKDAWPQEVRNQAQSPKPSLALANLRRLGAR